MVGPHRPSLALPEELQLNAAPQRGDESAAPVRLDAFRDLISPGAFWSAASSGWRLLLGRASYGRGNPALLFLRDGFVSFGCRNSPLRWFVCL